MDYLSAVEGQDYEDVQGIEGRSVNGEEVYRAHIRHVILDERPPSLRRGAGTPDHVFGDADIVAEFEQFTVDAGCAPKPIVG